MLSERERTPDSSDKNKMAEPERDPVSYIFANFLVCCGHALVLRVVGVNFTIHFYSLATQRPAEHTLFELAVANSLNQYGFIGGAFLSDKMG